MSSKVKLYFSEKLKCNKDTASTFKLSLSLSLSTTTENVEKFFFSTLVALFIFGEICVKVCCLA